MGSSDGAKRPYHLRVFDFVVALALCLSSPEPSAPAPAADSVLDPQVRQKISVALAHWRQVKRREDEHWDAAFTALRTAMDAASYLDVRLYMYNHSDEAFSLFLAYERGTYD